MSHVIAISNQKGGVGKTTTAVNLSVELALSGKKVLLIDLDPQGNAGSGLGVTLSDVENGDKDMYDVFLRKATLAEIIRMPFKNSGRTDDNSEEEGKEDLQLANLFLAPASRDLIGVEVELGKTPGRELILRSQIKLLSSTFGLRFDYIIMDLPPSLGLLTLNGLGAAKWVIIPVQAEYYALEGLTSLMETISFTQNTFNRSLDLLGLVVTMYDARTKLSAQVSNDLRDHFNELVFDTIIPRSVRLSESPSHGLPIALYAPDSSGGRAYASLAKELDERLSEFKRPRKDLGRAGNF